MKSPKETIVDLQLEALPAYAGFLLDNKVNDFVKTYYRVCVALDVPLLKFFQGMAEQDIIALSTGGAVRLLTALKTSTIPEYIEYAKDNWLKNQLPIISKEDVIVDDISLINYARKHALREYLREYTEDPGETFKILDEIDRFITSLEADSFKTYIGIQQAKLNDSNELLRRRESELLEAQSLGKIGSFEWDLTGNKRSSFTPELFKIFEFEKTSTLELFLNDVHPEDRLKLKAAIEKSMHDGIYECEYRYSRNNKNKVLYSRGKVFSEKGQPVRLVGTVTDVTEKAQLITRLTENEELSKQAQALTNTGSWKWSIGDDNIEWSDEMYRIYGLEPQSEKITFNRFVAFIHEDDRARRIKQISDALATGTSTDYVMRIISQDGTEKVLKGKGKVLRDKAGTSTGMLGTCQDITNEFHLTSELQKKNQELIRKNRDLESFNFIASHDLQEPLRKIQIYSNRIIQEAPVEIPDKFREYFDKISHASNKMQKMIEDFLIFYHSMNTDEPVDNVSLNDVVAEASAALSETIAASNASLLTDDLHPIRGRKLQLTQLMKHLIDNAVKFAKTDTPIEIRLRTSVERNDEGRKSVVLTVADNGIGFDPKYSSRIFELFQRLHGSDEYPGSGIGLSLCKKIAEDHNGSITVSSEPGKGTTFSVWLPAPE